MELHNKNNYSESIIYSLVNYDRFTYITKAEQYKEEGTNKDIKSIFNNDIYRVFCLDTSSELHYTKYFTGFNEAYYYYEHLRQSKEHMKIIRESTV